MDGEQFAEITAQGYRGEDLDVARQRAWVEIDHGALAHNIQALKSLLAPKTELLAVVKANAYGHGVIEVAETVLKNGATWLAIATLGEGIEVREAGINAPILVLGATNTVETFTALTSILSSTMPRFGRKSFSPMVLTNGFKVVPPPSKLLKNLSLR